MPNKPPPSDTVRFFSHDSAKLAYDYETRSDPYKLCRIWNANDDDEEGGSASDVADESTDRAHNPAEAQATDEGGRPDVVVAAAAQVAMGELAQPIETVAGPGPSTSAAIAAAIALIEEEGQGTFRQATLSDKIAYVYGWTSVFLVLED